MLRAIFVFRHRRRAVHQGLGLDAFDDQLSPVLLTATYFFVWLFYIIYTLGGLELLIEPLPFQASLSWPSITKRTKLSFGSNVLNPYWKMYSRVSQCFTWATTYLKWRQCNVLDCYACSSYSHRVRTFVERARNSDLYRSKKSASQIVGDPLYCFWFLSTHSVFSV